MCLEMTYSMRDNANTYGMQGDLWWTMGGYCIDAVDVIPAGSTTRIESDVYGAFASARTVYRGVFE